MLSHKCKKETEYKGPAEDQHTAAKLHKRYLKRLEKKKVFRKCVHKHTLQVWVDNYAPMVKQSAWKRQKMLFVVLRSVVEHALMA